MLGGLGMLGVLRASLSASLVTEVAEVVDEKADESEGRRFEVEDGLRTDWADGGRERLDWADGGRDGGAAGPLTAIWISE